MEVLRKEKKLCLSCMQEHPIDIVKVEEHEMFRGVKVRFHSIYEYCPYTDEYSETEEMIRANGLAVKDAYRKELSLLTSDEIKKKREKYCISQKDFSEVLNWGAATITRYENHQIQDRAHDDILRKINEDPSWFIEMLKRAEGKISPKKYAEYLKNALRHIRKDKNPYSNIRINNKVSFDVASIACASFGVSSSPTFGSSLIYRENQSKESIVNNGKVIVAI